MSLDIGRLRASYGIASELAFTSQWARPAIWSGTAHSHREIEDGVVVLPRFPEGSQRIGQLTKPRLAACLRINRAPDQAANPPHYVRVHDHSTLVEVQTQVRAGNVVSNAGQFFQISEAFGHGPVSLGDFGGEELQ